MSNGAQAWCVFPRAKKHSPVLRLIYPFAKSLFLTLKKCCLRTEHQQVFQSRGKREALPKHNGFPFQKKKQKEPQLFQPASLSLPHQHKRSPCVCCKAAGTAMDVKPCLHSSQRICQMQTSSDPKFPSLPCSSWRSLRLEPLPAWHNPGSNCCFHAPFEGLEQVPQHRPLTREDMDLCRDLGWFLLQA